MINNSLNPYFNLALEEYLLKQRDLSGDIFLLWQNNPAIIVGRHQNTWDEINHKFVRRNKITVARRMTGGGAVYHDLGNLNFTFIVRGQQPGHYDFASFARPVVAALKSLGAAAEFSGRNDILVGGKKISGNAQYRYKDSVLHHGTLLFDSDLGSLVQALNVNREKFTSKGVASVRSRVTNIKEHLAVPLTIKDFESVLAGAVFEAKGKRYKEYGLSRKDLTIIEELVKTKYGTWDWNYGASPGYNLRQSKRFPWGNMEILLDIRGGAIAGCRIYGDFFAKKDMGQLEQQLVNLPLQETALRQALEKINLSAYIDGLDKEVIINMVIS